MAKVVRYQQAGSRKVPVVELVDTNTSLVRTRRQPAGLEAVGTRSDVTIDNQHTN